MVRDVHGCEESGDRAELSHVVSRNARRNWRGKIVRSDSSRDLSQHQSFADERESKNEFRRALFVEKSWFMARRINDRASAAGVDD